MKSIFQGYSIFLSFTLHQFSQSALSNSQYSLIYEKQPLFEFVFSGTNNKFDIISISGKESNLELTGTSERKTTLAFFKSKG